ncbi:TPT-domain-containing protein, partial [Rhizoclosmatium globosum]
KDQLIVLLFSFLYTANIAFSTISMSMVSLAFHQIVRSMNPVVTLGMEFLFLGKWRQGVPSDIVSSLGVIIFGVGLATLGDYEFTLAGFLMTFLGTILSALKGITTHTLLAGNGLQFHPIELIWRMSGLSFLQCLYMSYTNGEVDRFLFWLNPTWLYVALAVNGIMAFFVNYVSFSANKKVGALSIAVAGNVKQVMILVISVWVFGFSIALVNGCGIFMTLVGGAWYSMIGVAAKKAKKQLA